MMLLRKSMFSPICSTPMIMELKMITICTERAMPALCVMWARSAAE